MAAQQMIGIEHGDERAGRTEGGGRESEGGEGTGGARWRTGLELRAQRGKGVSSSEPHLFDPPPPASSLASCRLSVFRVWNER